MVTRTAQGHLTITRQRNGKNGTDGTSVLAQYSANGSSWHSSFQSGDLYMRTSTDSGKTWSSAVRIVGESGTNGSYIEYSFAISAQTETTNVSTAPTISGSWSDAPLSVTKSYPYLWCRMISVDKDGNKAAARYVRITGEKGDDGTTIKIKDHVTSASKLPTSGNTEGDAYVADDTGHLHVWTGSSWSDVGQFKGDNGEKAYLHIAYANSADGATDFTTDDTKADGHSYIGTYADNTESDSTTPSDYNWQKVQGEQGYSIVSLLSTSTFSYSQETWNTISAVGTSRTWRNVTNSSDFRVGDIAIVSGTVSDRNDLKVLYYGKVTKVTSSQITTSAIALQSDGSNGVGVSLVDVEYATSTSNSTAPTSGWQTDAPAWVDGQYLWTRTHIVYTDDSEKYTDAVCITGSKGSTGNGIASVVEQYYRSISAYYLSGGSWSTTRPDWVNGTFMWTRSKITYTNGVTSYSNAICVTGATGATGNGVSKVVREYYKSTSATTLSGGSWSETVPEWENGTYIWLRDHIYYTNGTESYTDPWNSTGEKGEQGNTGTSITAVVSYYVATTKQSGVTRSNTSGWSTAFPTPTSAKPFVWKYVRTALDNGTYQYSDAELIAIYQTGANPNLLDDTSFESEYGLDAWTVRSQYAAQTGQTPSEDSGTGINSSGVLGLNSYLEATSHSQNVIRYKEILEQILQSADKTTRRIEAGTQYTFSFYAKCVVSDVTINQTSSAYGFATKTLYLTAGVTYQISFYGYVSSAAKNAGKELRVFLHTDGWTESTSGATSNTSPTLVTFRYTPKTTGLFYLRSYLYDNSSSEGTATVQFYRVTQSVGFLATYIYPSIVDTSKPIFVDGVEKTAGSDLSLYWGLTTSFVRHTVTFTTKSSIPSVDQKLLFRLLPSIMDGQRVAVSICAPKLEVGMIATAYMESSKSLRGAQLRVTEFESGKEYLSGKLGELYHDVVYSNGNVFNCIKSYISSSTLPEDDTEHWKQGDQREMIATKVLLAQNARIDVMSGNEITVYDEDGNVSGGMQGNPTQPIFWAGAKDPTDGTWQQNIDGSVMYGDPNGERIEISPSEKSIKFFNSSNKFVTEHSAKSVGVMTSLLPSGGSVALNKAGSDNTLSQSDIWYGQTGTVVDEVSDLFKPTSNGILVVNMTRLTLTQTTASTTKSDAHPTSSIKILVRAFSDSAGTKKIYDQNIAQLGLVGSCNGSTYYQSSNIKQGSVTLSSSYYYKILVELTYFGGGTANKTSVSGTYNITNALISSDFYSSMFFGNGLVLSKSSDEYFAAMIEQGSHMRVSMSNGQSGIDLSYANGVRMKRGSYWYKQPVTLLALKITVTSSSATIGANLTGVSFTTGTTPTDTTGAISRSGDGRCILYFPKNWSTYQIGSKGVANATAVRASGNGWWARVVNITDTYMIVETADDDSGNNGTMFVELKV